MQLLPAPELFPSCGYGGVFHLSVGIKQASRLINLTDRAHCAWCQPKRKPYCLMSCRLTLYCSLICRSLRSALCLACNWLEEDHIQKTCYWMFKTKALPSHRSSLFTEWDALKCRAAMACTDWLYLLVRSGLFRNQTSSRGLISSSYSIPQWKWNEMYLSVCVCACCAHVNVMK